MSLLGFLRRIQSRRRMKRALVYLEYPSGVVPTAVSVPIKTTPLKDIRATERRAALEAFRRRIVLKEGWCEHCPVKGTCVVCGSAHEGPENG